MVNIYLFPSNISPLGSDSPTSPDDPCPAVSSRPVVILFPIVIQSRRMRGGRNAHILCVRVRVRRVGPFVPQYRLLGRSIVAARGRESRPTPT
ncbi:Hypothetical protein NTJ_01911 [Nesidiocoris tenuis]|uniref:Uncharacterized protein n=1 Tax=Nesidiocoris tenuis TaxID=355587 RepID=A0ABN7ACN1_9HEMI|nr:Hypothetical protein NTJ_01911 [Nesidiocoris tenuis]